MPRMLVRFIFLFSTCTVALVGTALGASMAGEIALTDPSVSPKYIAFLAFCFAAVVTIGAPSE